MGERLVWAFLASLMCQFVAESIYQSNAEFGYIVQLWLTTPSLTQAPLFAQVAKSSADVAD
jgi:hypothetical protein